MPDARLRSGDWTVIHVLVEWGAPGARAAGGRGNVVVLIDALRASVTIASALAAGADRVIPVVDVEDAFALGAEKGYLIAGERGGAKVPGFDFGNSPNEMMQNAPRLRGRTLILTTSNGTRCLHAATAAGSAVVLAGALPNAAAVLHAALGLSNRLKRHVTLLAAGIDDTPADEDEFAARLLAARMARQKSVHVDAGWDALLDEGRSEPVFLGSEAGRRLGRLGYGSDVRYCARTDTLNVVPVYIAGDGFVSLTPRVDLTIGRGGTAE